MTENKKYNPWAFAGLITLCVAVTVFAVLRLNETAAIASIISMILSTIPILAMLHRKDETTQDRSSFAPSRRNPTKAESAMSWSSRLGRHPLALGATLLAVAVGLASSVSIIRYSALWPWWTIVIATLLSIPVMISARKDNTTEWWLYAGNLGWAFVYSITLMLYRAYSFSPFLQLLGAECWLFVIVNVVILAKPRSADLRLPVTRKLLAGYMIIGLGLTALAFEITSFSTLPLFDFAGVILLFALLVSLIDAVAIMKERESGAT